MDDIPQIDLERKAKIEAAQKQATADIEAAERANLEARLLDLTEQWAALPDGESRDVVAGEIAIINKLLGS